jgi:hypothetical protein
MILAVREGLQMTKITLDPEILPPRAVIERPAFTGIGPRTR